VDPQATKGIAAARLAAFDQTLTDIVRAENLVHVMRPGDIR
jgi:hypothetical protein